MSKIADRICSLVTELPINVKLIAVSKFQPIERIKEAYNAGHRAFGENRPQEMATKAEIMPKDIEWHFIGSLQRNKVNMVLPYVYLIHSVDSIKLFDEILKNAYKYCSEQRPQINILLQYRIATEETKQGFTEIEILKLLDRIQLEYDLNKDYSFINIRGLMGMATYFEDISDTQSNKQLNIEFSSAKVLFEKIKLRNYFFLTDFSELSMGMTNDYCLAIENGSTLVRIGTYIFGNR